MGTVELPTIADASPQAVSPWVLAYAHFEGVHLVLHKVGRGWFVCWGNRRLLDFADPHDDGFRSGRGFDDYDSALAAFEEAAERLREGRL